MHVQEPSVKPVEKDIDVLHYGLVRNGNRRQVLPAASRLSIM